MTEKLLSVQGIGISFGGLKAVSSVSFDVAKGEIVGLLGPNGAGKTTCFNMISGVYKPTEGRIFWDNLRTDGMPPHKMALLGIGRTFQIVHPFAELTVQKNILIALGYKQYRGLKKLFTPWNRAFFLERAQEILRTVGLAAVSDRIAGQLPLGNLRRLEIARALALDPKLLLLDESFSGLRHEEIAQIEQLVLKIRSMGVSILLIEHNMRVAMGLSDRIVVLDHGCKLAEGVPSDIAKNPLVIEAYLGTEGGSDRA